MAGVNYRAAQSSAAVFVSVALLAAGCSSSKAGGGAASSSTAAGSPSASGGAVTAVTATEKEFSISLSSTTFRAGAYTFTVKNVGKFPHNLTIEGPGLDKKASPTLPGGGTGTVSVALEKGSYEVWCSVDSHKDKGMDLHIAVS